MKLTRLLTWLLLAAGVFWTGLYLVRFYNPKVFVPVRGEFVRIGRQQLYTLQKGTGRTILLLSGMPGHADAYQSWFDRPWPGSRLLAVDFPGAGMSDKQVPASSTPEDLALAVKLLLDKLEIKEADIVGEDLGGGVAMILGANYPNLVRRLVLVAPDSSFGSAGEKLGWWWRNPVVLRVWAAVALGRGYIRDLLMQGWAPGPNGWVDFVESYYKPLESAGGRQGFLSLQSGRYPFDYQPYEERIQARTLILWGQEDRTVPPSAGEALSGRLAHATCVKLPDVGHFPLEEAPQAVLAAVLDFLGPPAEPGSQGPDARP